MSVAEKCISNFGTIEVVQVKELGKNVHAVTYAVHSSDPRALDLVGKAARTLSNRRFDCINRSDSTIMMHVVGSSFLALNEAEHPFNNALFKAIEQTVHPATRGDLVRRR